MITPSFSSRSTRRFTAVADSKKGVRNEEIVALIHEVTGQTAAAAR